jgi:tetratricopeptide (TPR) repeat protein
MMVVLLGSALLLSGCETVEEKAEANYQSALELAEAGDVDRAIVELRAVFKLDGEHRDARMFYAQLQKDKGELEEAYGHYLLVTEQYPEFVPARIELAHLAMDLGVWDETKRHAEAAEKISPDNIVLRPIMIAVEYRDAVQNSDPEAEASAVERAEQYLESTPEDMTARQVVLDNYVRNGRLDSALDSVNIALEFEPLNRQLNQVKLSLLAQMEDMAGLGAQLRAMVERFPENREIRTALVRWYLANDDADGAEQFVRDLVARSGDETPPRLALVQFLNQVRGIDAALLQVDTFIEEGLDDQTFKLLKASLLFDSGERDLAISQVEALIDGQASTDDVRNMQTTLARMLLSTGDKARAQEIVAAVLQEDAADQNALKLHANWLIEEDKVRDAVLALRTALDESPSDPETITLLARAYERGGNRELMAESLSLAVQASNANPTESLRYARFLISDDKLLSAEDVLLQSLRLAPSNLELLRMLSEVYLAMNDLPRAEQVVTALRGLGSVEAQTLANGVQAAVFQRSARADESIELMQNMISEGQSALVAQTAIIRTRLANGELIEARSFMNDLLSQTPEDSPDRIGVLFLNAALTATEGDYDSARAIYRGILSSEPEIEAVWRALIATVVREGSLDEAVSIVDESLVALPGSANLRWIKAGLAEQQGEIEEAIELYEALYADDSNSTIIANNLASMITTYRDDEESLERAFVIARRLRGTDFPAFQDTYGWIAYRLGNYEDALENLEPAAAGLPGDPTVQYHLARLYEAMERDDEALKYYDIALSLWADSPVPLVAQARKEREALSLRLEGGEPENDTSSGETITE